MRSPSSMLAFHLLPTPCHVVYSFSTAPSSYSPSPRLLYDEHLRYSILSLCSLPHSLWFPASLMPPPASSRDKHIDPVSMCSCGACLFSALPSHSWDLTTQGPAVLIVSPRSSPSLSLSPSLPPWYLLSSLTLRLLLSRWPAHLLSPSPHCSYLCPRQRLGSIASFSSLPSCSLT